VTEPAFSDTGIKRRYKQQKTLMKQVLVNTR